MNDWPSVLAELQLLLSEKFGITHLTLQPESQSHILCPIPFNPR
jgi:hypothetical protein